MGAPTDAQWEQAFSLLQAGSSVLAAAKQSGIPRSTLRYRLDKGKQDGDAPDGFYVTHRSTLYDKRTGEEMLEWVKTALDRDKHAELARVAIDALLDEVVPTSKTEEPNADADLLVAYNIGDAHLGSYVWGPECSGGSSDLAIAERDLMTAVDRLVASTPDAEEAIVVNVGDWFHTDTSKPFTPASGNLLDTGDSRWPKVVSSGVKIQREICRRALQKHKRVRLRNAKGNHDPHSGIILDVAMKAYFENEPRLIVEDSPRDLWHFRFGSNLIGITHGHNIKPENIPGVLAVDAREEWGQCEYRFVWVGHFHAKKVLDVMGTRVTVWPTLAANDKWHSDKGYRSQKEMCAVVLHKDFGVMEEHTAGLKMIRSAGHA
jgi:predicted phosphodiesterase